MLTKWGNLLLVNGPFMKTILILMTSLLVTACAGAPAPSGEESELRSAQPGVVDHNVIPKRK